MRQGNPTDCELYAESVSLLATGDASSAEAESARRHLECCAVCQERFRQLSALVDDLCGDAPTWLSAAEQSVVERVGAVTCVSSATDSVVLPADVTRAGALRASGIDHRRAWQRTALWVAGGALAGAAGWWWLGAINPDPPSRGPAAPQQQLLADRERGREQLRGPVQEATLEDAGVPTWWELQRSAFISDEAFEQMLARNGPSGGSNTFEMKTLFRELMQ